MRGFLSQKGGRARHLGTSVGASLGLSVGFSLCAGALIVGPLTSSAFAAPTLGSDQNGPQVQILQPGYQDVLKGRTKILIAVKAQKFNPQFVEMFIDDKPATDGPIAFAAPSAQYNWDTKLFSDGPHKLMVRVTDTQGFRGWAEVNIIINNQRKIDTAPPSLSWKNATSFQQFSGTASIELQALDNFGVKMLMVSLKSASDINAKVPPRSWLFNRPPYIVKFDTTKVPDGLYQLSAKAYDSFEQEGEAPPLTLGVVNSSVNATTMGDMLAAMARVDASNRKESAPAKTTESPAKVSAKTEAKSVGSNANTTVAKAGATRTASGASANMNSTSANLLSPSVPATNTRAASSRPQTASGAATKVQSPLLPFKVLQLGKPQVNHQSEASASKNKTSAPQNEIRHARVARATAPADSNSTAAQTAANDVSNEASLSALKSRTATEITPQMRVASAPGNDTAASGIETIGASRLAMPQSSERSLSGAPVWSETEGQNAPLLTPNSPLQVERPQSVREGRLGLPSTLIARGETPTSDAASTPQISDLSAAPQPKMSAFDVLKSRLETAKTPRVGKMASPDNRLAALPRAQKSERRGAINAITVSPLEINVSDALPAFHVAARSTDLRAVAARYGLPVEVVAANNGWKTSKVLAVGERVKLPTQLKVAYHGVPVTGDAPSLLVGGTGVTAFRFMFEMAGGKLVWDAKKQRVTARKGESEVVLNIGSNTAKVGDKDVMMELAAFLFEGRTMVPLRFFEEGLHADVDWDPQTGRLVVAMAN